METKNKFCPNYSTVINAYDTDNKRHLVMRTRCKQWSCEYCAKRNKNEWRFRIMDTIEKLGDDEQWFLWTLTLSPRTHKTGSTSTSLSVWRKHWNKLMNKLRYRLGKFMYVRVFETHKSGVLHVHMLANKTFDDVIRIEEKHPDQSVNYRHHSNTLEQIMLSYGLGKIHDIKPIVTTEYEENGHARNVSAYVTKYLTKDIQSDVRKVLQENKYTHVRMIQTSHGWTKLKNVTKYEWRQGRILFAEYYEDLKQGIDLYDLNMHMEVEGIHFGKDGHHDVYPPQSELSESSSSN